MKNIKLLLSVLAALMLVSLLSTVSFAGCVEHVFGEWDYPDPERTCDVPGKRMRHCVECGYSETEYIPATDHVWSEWILHSNNCNTDSYETRYCLNCGLHENVNLGKIGEHSFGSWSTIIDASCTEDGLKRRTCRYCKLVEEELIPNLGGHELTGWQFHDPANCLGWVREANFCGLCMHVEYRDVYSPGEGGAHSWGERIKVSDPTCTELGVEKAVCTLCSEEELYYTDYAKHVYGEWYVYIEPGCDVDGMEHRDCLNCGFFDSRHITATGLHSWNEWRVREEPSCVPGLEYRDCANCDRDELREIPANGNHEWRPGSFKMPTCLDGFESMVCAQCGLVETEILPATGAHMWGLPTVAMESTCIEEGVRIYPCIECGDEYREGMQTAPHIWRGWTPNPDGSFSCYCAYCGERELQWLPQNPFGDVKGGAWYTMSILYCFDLGYMSGVGDGLFDYKGTMDRQMFAVILSKIDRADLAPYTEMSFADVKAGQWYSSAIEWAYQNGYASGIGEGVYGRKSFVTREQLAVFFYTYSQNKGYDVDGRADLSVFADSGRIHSWAYDAMSWALDAGIISGTGENTLSPRDHATRAQVSVIIMTYTQSIPNYTRPDPASGSV